MESSIEILRELRTKLKRLLIVYSKIKYNELKLFNLLSQEIEHLREENKNCPEKSLVVNQLLTKFQYPRELIIEPLPFIPKVEPFTLTSWVHYSYLYNEKGEAQY